MLTFSLYIHYPFCVRRCPYCGFATQVDQANDAERYRVALLAELRMRLAEEPWRGGEVTSIYFGGGTPSLMPPDFCSSILQSKIQNPKSKIEITIEANPTTRDAKNFRAFREAGVNRISIGAQSFQPAELELLGRWHSPNDVADTVRLAREGGFDNVSLDLIYGVPGQTVASFQSSVNRALELEIDHLSTYTLSVEPNTPFAQRVSAKTLPSPDPDLAADQYAILIEMMRAAGFEHYELTNYAKPDKWSRHNYTYWQRTPYLGVGLGAHSYDGRRRFWNTRQLKEYLSRLDIGKSAEEGEEELSPDQKHEEEVYLSLRTREGLDPILIGGVVHNRAVSRMIEKGFLVWCGDRLHVPEERWLLLDEVVLQLLPGAIRR